MSSGTGGSYWADKALPSVFKHELLKRYLPQFGGMTGSRSHDKRVVYLDGYAGEGRYENGEPASAELALRIAADLQSRAGLTLLCFFSESQPKSFDLLHEVVQQYRASGVLAHAHRGEVDGVLDQVVDRAEQNRCSSSWIRAGCSCPRTGWWTCWPASCRTRSGPRLSC
ncbi:hypothetical protein AR457_37505 [Streptomyces agglomeratus]|uniref:three-Cys-motif partner protein TcmP n=1 Tax=Streptomyces agglomeratus TaxID=285458 RepID=UPI00086E4197|nr:three-Cys-motif partner protein TcmP [Streptomyces agglomeratus]OEJ22923.1 hypothetical protein AR457_37505 [Streptomyces agglomeratus]